MKKTVPLELQFLLRKDHSLTVEDYWIEGNGWDTEGIRHDIRVVRQQQVCDLAKTLATLPPIVVDDCSGFQSTGNGDSADAFDDGPEKDAINDRDRMNHVETGSWNNDSMSSPPPCEASDAGEEGQEVSSESDLDEDTDDTFRIKLGTAILGARGPSQVSSSSAHSIQSVEVEALPPEVDLTATPDVDFQSSSLQHAGIRVQYLDDGSVARWTQRPDGSWRKPERKRRGWECELERKKYICPRLRPSPA